MMIVKELIQQLQQLVQESTIELFHEQYCGGGDEASFDEPVIFVDEYGTPFLTAAHKKDALEHEVGLVFSPEMLPRLILLSQLR